MSHAGATLTERAGDGSVLLRTVGGRTAPLKGSRCRSRPGLSLHRYERGGSWCGGPRRSAPRRSDAGPRESPPRSPRRSAPGRLSEHGAWLSQPGVRGGTARARARARGTGSPQGRGRHTGLAFKAGCPHDGAPSRLPPGGPCLALPPRTN